MESLIDLYLVSSQIHLRLPSLPHSFSIDFKLEFHLFPTSSFCRREKKKSCVMSCISGCGCDTLQRLVGPILSLLGLYSLLFQQNNPIFNWIAAVGLFIIICVLAQRCRTVKGNSQRSGSSSSPQRSSPSPPRSPLRRYQTHEAIAVSVPSTPTRRLDAMGYPVAPPVVATYPYPYDSPYQYPTTPNALPAFASPQPYSLGTYPY
jgi:hypothetical protein